jgi:DNA-binding NarL/FixJ family response regulator
MDAGAQVHPLRVVLADDAVLVREGVARLLATAGMDIVGQAGDAVGLLAVVERERPDIAIVDIRMPPTWTLEGLEAARRIRDEHPSTSVLLLSTYVEAEDAMDLLSSSAGGVGYLLKDSVSNVDEFVAAVRRVAGGGSTIDSSLVAELFSRHRRTDPLAELTPREREVLVLMAQGRSNAGIASELFVTEGAVEKYVKNVLAKLEIQPDQLDHRRVLAVLKYLDTT